MISGLSVFRQKLQEGQSLTIDFLGDSITWGLNHCSDEETFVACFARIFAEKYPHYAVYRYDGIVTSEASPLTGFEKTPVGNLSRPGECAIIRNGVGGNTVRRAINRRQDFLGAMPNGRKADLTFLMFGINDALFSDKKKYVTPAIFRRDYEELLFLLASTGTCPIILTPTYNGTQYPLDEYAEVCRALARERDLPLIDLHELWMRHYDEKAPHFGQGDWLSDSKTDACHFSPEGARATADALFRAFRKLVEE